MLAHLAAIGITATLVALLTVYPFLPGSYDALAVAVSGMAQVVGAAGVLLIPIGVAWLIHECRTYAQTESNRPHSHATFYFATVSMIACAMFAIVLAGAALGGVGLSLAVATMGLAAYIAVRLLPALKSLRRRAPDAFNPVPLYLIVLPGMALIAQMALHQVATEYSRTRAIANSAALIDDIENYHAANGHYPRSLSALHQDYEPSVIGIERFHYALNGDAYNVYFEQPTFLFVNFGTREIVMYNKRDEHQMVSHDSDILRWTAEQLRARRGWNARHDTSIRHWKTFGSIERKWTGTCCRHRDRSRAVAGLQEAEG